MTLTNTATKAVTLVLAASFAATTALPVAEAQAGHKKHWKKHHYSHKHYIKRHKKRDRRGEALAAGIIGFAIGAILADQANRKPDVVYVKPGPRYEPRPLHTDPYVERRPIRDRYEDKPRVIRYDDEAVATYEPWTPEWARWCDNKYRSFNPNTGTFRGYDGRDHFCVVK